MAATTNRCVLLRFDESGRDVDARVRARSLTCKNAVAGCVCVCVCALCVRCVAVARRRAEMTPQTRVCGFRADFCVNTTTCLCVRAEREAREEAVRASAGAVSNWQEGEEEWRQEQHEALANGCVAAVLFLFVFFFVVVCVVCCNAWSRFCAADER